ncbi:hypothetical protein IM816_07255 [Luteibacter flocculans]|uniref:Uncharacterized protein n=1 Tax=Luteibacter flocculans TaxID=2780091 RepID=A0ABY4T7G4_9GAMM|nr:hypothetical protein [Luteibacter flocculans]URL59878.1 hypothetical protein IM816_07255 [Luteibacter flocculans]
MRFVLDFRAAVRFTVAFFAVVFFADDFRAVAPPARLRVADFFAAVPDERFFDAARLSCAAFFFVALLAVFEGLAFTPARRAFDNPMAIACFAERAPCLPSRTCSISSCTNSPAWVEADFPSRLSFFALATVFFSGMSGLLCAVDQGTRIAKASGVSLGGSPSPSG